MARDGYDGGNVYVDIEPDDTSLARFEQKLARKLEPKADKLGESIGRKISQQIAASINAGLSDSLGKGSDRPAREGGRRSGEAYSGEFDRTVRSKIQSALRSLPPIQIGAATNEAEQKLRDLQVQLLELSGKEIGVDIDAALALAEVDRIRGELDRLGAESPDVQVRVDIASASAKLAAVQAEINHIDGQDPEVDVHVNTAVAQAGLGALIGVGASIGTILVPAAGAAVAAIGAIGPAAIAGAGGLGVLALGFSGVLGAVQALIQAEGGGAAAVEKADRAVAGLSPVGQRLTLLLYGLKPAFEQLRGVAEGLLLPGVEAGIRALLPILPAVSTNIGILAGVMGQLFAQAGQALASPFWVDFFNQMTAVAVPILQLMAPTLLNVAKGFAGMMLAFAPLAPMIGQYLLQLSQRFAAFGTSLSSNPAFQQFIDYVITNAPMLLSLLGDLAIVALKLLIAFAPLGQIMLELTTSIVGWLASLDPGVLAAIFGALLAVAAAISVAIGTAIGGAVSGVVGAGALIVAAVAAIVGAVIYAWQRFEGFRDVVTTVWNAIVTAALWAWNAVLRPVFDGIVFVVMQILVPAFLDLWQYGIRPVWSAIVAVISFAWAIIQPILNAIWFVVSEFLIPVFMMLWQNVIMPAWQGIQIAISIAWAVIQVVFGLIQIGIKVLAEVFTWLWHTILEPVWNGITAAISWAWERIRPIFVMLGNFIKDHVAPAFQSGVAAISQAWSGIRDAAKAPVRFVVDTVLNNGLLAGYNKLAKLFNVKPDNVHIGLPNGFATGGLIRGAGSGTSDSILAQVVGGPKIRVSNGEYIIPEHAVRRYGVGFFNWLAGKPNARFPGDGSQGLAFAGGGLLDFAGDLWDAVSNPAKLIAGPINGLIDRIPGSGFVRDVVGGTARSLLGGLLGWVKSFGGDGSNVGKTRAFLLTQRGKPYIWASAGPEGYDCSGLVSAAWNVMHGRNPYSHTFSTSNQAGFFPKPGHGIFTAGWANPGERGGGSVGHTAGLLAGLGFESRGGDGVVIGTGTTSVDSFAHVGTFDQGGYLPPGLTLAYNGTGQPEAVFTDGQLGELKRGAGSSAVNVYPQRADFTITDLQALMDRRDALDRVGRAS